MFVKLTEPGSERKIIKQLEKEIERISTVIDSHIRYMSKFRYRNNNKLIEKDNKEVELGLVNKRLIEIGIETVVEMLAEIKKKHQKIDTLKKNYILKDFITYTTEYDSEEEDENEDDIDPWSGGTPDEFYGDPNIDNNIDNNIDLKE